MKLELKHLAPYLPYRLKIINILGKGSTWTLTQFNIEQFSDDDKPILRPLSDITKEIEHKGKKFMPIEEIKESQHHLFFREDIKNPLEGLQYSEIQKLFAWHFDVFGLIDRGLAIDINTL